MKCGGQFGLMVNLFALEALENLKILEYLEFLEFLEFLFIWWVEVSLT